MKIFSPPTPPPPIIRQYNFPFFYNLSYFYLLLSYLSLSLFLFMFSFLETLGGTQYEKKPTRPIAEHGSSFTLNKKSRIQLMNIKTFSPLSAELKIRGTIFFIDFGPDYFAVFRKRSLC